VADREPSDQVDQADTEARPAAVSFVTTEHFTLQGARSSTVAEATGRASMFLSAVSGGLVAFGLVGTAAGVGAAFYAFGLVLLPTLAFVGLVTFDRVLQSGIEDYGYAQRIARLRAYYFQYAPELVDYLLSVPPARRLSVQGLRGGRWQVFLTVAALVAGVLVAVAALVWLMRSQASAWERAATAPLFADELRSE
jgi:hypothetical protein